MNTSTVSLCQPRVAYMSFAALLVISGVIVKNTYEQMGQKDNTAAKWTGMALFLVGWAKIAYLCAVDNNHKFRKWEGCFVVVAVAMIIAAVMMMKQKMTAGEDVPMYLPSMFAVGWVALGYFAAPRGKLRNQLIGVMAGVLVSVSMLWVLPWQRKEGIIDGPGMPLFVLGWMFLILANSMK